RPPPPNPTPAALSSSQKTEPVSFSPLPPPEGEIPQRMSTSKPAPDGPFRGGARREKRGPQNRVFGDSGFRRSNQLPELAQDHLHRGPDRYHLSPAAPLQGAVPHQ